MLAMVQCKEPEERVTTRLAGPFLGVLLLVACVDNGNDVGFRLAASVAGSGTGGMGGMGGASSMSPGTTLPPLPRLMGVHGSVTGDSVDITLEPIEDAVDYRVYALPPNQDITLLPDGEIAIKNAVYRCAGKRQVPAVAVDAVPPVQSGYMKTLVDGQDVNGYVRSLEEATLGHVYLEPGKDRVPVYALGDSDPFAENEYYSMRWAASRVKEYVTDETERVQLLDRGYRDDGVAFYVPTLQDDKTRFIYTSTDAMARYYFTDGAEAAIRTSPTPAFLALADAAPGTVPLMRVFYLNLSNGSHDELAAGKPRFERARRQGDQLPMFDLHWSGLREKTTLVVEALSPGCPTLPGLLAPVSMPAADGRPAWLTIDEARAVTRDGALFVNGQHDPASVPRAIARAFLNDLEPQPAPDLDWSWGYDADEQIGTFTSQDCGALSGNCYQDFRQVSERFDAAFMLVENDRQVMAPLLGELWVMYDDFASGVNGKFRMTPPEKGQVSESAFLHVTMDVNSFTTARRYPQIIVSDQDVPVQHHLPLGNSLVIQPFSDWPNLFELQVCDHRTWDVNNQCPYADFDHVFDPNDATRELSLLPNAEVGEHVGVDRATRFEAYVSSRRVYLLLDGAPYGCFDLPATGAPNGPVTVTFGDTLFHSNNDQLMFYQYMRENLQHDAQRHFDNLGFKSGVSAPTWDEARLPCTSALYTRP